MDLILLQHKWAGLGEVLEGNELVKSDYSIRFRLDVDTSSICSVDLDESASDMFEYAVENHCMYL